MNRDFLTEAIADAKAVKESAIANAKVALEEAFSPQVKAMFASKLEEMEKEDNLEEGYDEIDEAKAEDKKDKVDEISEEKEIDEAKDKKIDEAEEIEEDLDLEEILAELEEIDLEEAKKDLPPPPPGDPLDNTVTEEEVDEAEDKMDGAEDEEKDDSDDDEEIDLENMSEEELKKFIEDVIEDMVEAGELEPADDFEDDVDVDVDADGDIEIEDDEETAVDEAKDIDEAKDKEDKDKVKEDLEEALETISVLRSELNEINLLNAKLLYTNRVFRGKNLTEAQKVKVLEAFDKAETVKEVKLVFETLDTSVKNSTRSRKPISEARTKGSASNLTATPTATTKQPIVESDAMVNRFKKLAGII
jgi:hypothetical protein